ncbi:hypothetical protein NHX12_012424 [Muraenolepis orangiensis]|uniref:Uncharacterized protein n=1 Tax=Muraenolepis orangiensis TaxID=630683 RepID=A0A9Q0DG41_9TELE|nr:hypothetical protein NHX12_012424 [Muraenolepis orangiensis]
MCSLRTPLLECPCESPGRYGNRIEPRQRQHRDPDPDWSDVRSLKNYSSQGRGSNGGPGDEDYEIPPITPPNHADPSLLHLMEHEAGYPFHALQHNGLLNPYSYPELPALMMSNMLGQDGHLLSGPMHSVHRDVS